MIARTHEYFFYNVFQLPNRTPPTPVRASRARWVGVRIHVILLGMVEQCVIWQLSDIHFIRNKWILKHKRLIILDLHREKRKRRQQI